MKKSLFCIAAGISSLFASVDASAQRSIDVGEVRFGAYVAPTAAWMHPTSKTDDNKVYNVDGDGGKTGFSYGLMAEYFFADNYALVTGLQMTTNGGKISMDRARQDGTTNTIRNAAFNYNITYLEIPVNLKLRTDELASGLRIFGQAGLTLGINVGKKAAYDITYFNANGDSEIISRDMDKLTSSKTLGATVAPVMLSMNLGAGLELPFNDKISGYFGIFFNNGFTPDGTRPNNYEIYNNQNELINVNSDFKDGNIRINNLAFRFGIYF